MDEVHRNGKCFTLFSRNLHLTSHHVNYDMMIEFESHGADRYTITICDFMMATIKFLAVGMTLIFNITLFYKPNCQKSSTLQKVQVITAGFKITLYCDIKTNCEGADGIWPQMKEKLAIGNEMSSRRVVLS